MDRHDDIRTSEIDRIMDENLDSDSSVSDLFTDDSDADPARLIPDKHLDTSRSHLETNDSDSDDPEIDQRRPTHTPRPRIPNQCRQVLSDNSDIDDNDEDSNDEGSIWEKVTT
ncbi:hypothetical protein J6590_034336 [Homalodisca vitripennis]|nr:hypothetical protein J6590_034336 [Homalodisca vitripennis]